MRRLLSITLLSVLLGVLLMAFAVPGMATEGEAPADTTEEADHAEGETTEETSHAEGEATDADHAEGEDEEHAASAEESDDGQWTGLLGAFVAALVIGTLVFASSGTAGLGDDGHH